MASTVNKTIINLYSRSCFGC